PPPPPRTTLFPYTTLFRSTEHLLLGIVREGQGVASGVLESLGVGLEKVRHQVIAALGQQHPETDMAAAASAGVGTPAGAVHMARSEEHTSELQSRFDLVCR